MNFPKLQPETNRTIVKWIVGGVVLIVLSTIGVIGYLIATGALDFQDAYDMTNMILDKKIEDKS